MKTTEKFRKKYIKGVWKIASKKTVAAVAFAIVAIAWLTALTFYDAYQHTNRQTEINQLRSDFDSRLGILENRTTSLMNNLTELSDCIDGWTNTLKNNITELTHDLSQLRDDFDKLGLDELKNRMTELETRLNSISNDLNEMKTDIEDLEKELLRKYIMITSPANDSCTGIQVDIQGEFWVPIPHPNERWWILVKPEDSNLVHPGTPIDFSYNEQLEGTWQGRHSIYLTGDYNQLKQPFKIMVALVTPETNQLYKYRLEHQIYDYIEMQPGTIVFDYVIIQRVQ